jgi:hypothetical protein
MSSVDILGQISLGFTNEFTAEDAERAEKRQKHQDASAASACSVVKPA